MSTETESEDTQYDETERHNLYHMTIDRETLNELCVHLSHLNKIDMAVEKDGAISFNIPAKSKINIKTFNFVKHILEEVLKLEKKQEGIDPQSKKYNTIEMKKEKYVNAIEVLMEAYSKLKK